MEQVWQVVVDTESVAGRLATSAAVLVVAVGLFFVSSWLVVRRIEDATARYYARKATRVVVAIITVLVLGVVWRAFAGRLGVVLGLATAGVAFAMQEVIGALAGWVNIVSGRIFGIGDRIQMAGVRGDVIDITPLRTKVMEMGSAQDEEMWVQGRQYTGRIVAISNKKTFTEPVFNYSGVFEFIWDELTVPVPYDADRDTAERILREEVEQISASAGAQEAIAAMTARYPIARSDVEPRVFVRATDSWQELAARFVLPVRSARRIKDGVTRRVLARFEEAGIPIASATQDVTVRLEDRPDGSDPRGGEH